MDHLFTTEMKRRPDCLSEEPVDHLLPSSSPLVSRSFNGCFAAVEQCNQLKSDLVTSGKILFAGQCVEGALSPCLVSDSSSCCDREWGEGMISRKNGLICLSDDVPHSLFACIR